MGEAYIVDSQFERCEHALDLLEVAARCGRIENGQFDYVSI